jgi:filamentous hemagglutinin
VPNLTPANIGLSLAPINAQNVAGTPVFALNLSGLFSFADPTKSYLVETDPAFAGYSSFLSSDYFLSRLGYDPARVQRRLGDALYEQQLISKQLVGQAGVSRLTGYADNESQYRSLMDAGILVAQKFNLAPGIGLSAEQMATLTSSIVLLVEVEVQGPDGALVKVLAPRVYLAAVDQRDLTGGALISGNDVRLRTADGLTNSGVIRATRSTVIDSGSVNNLGRIDFGEAGLAQTRGNFVSSGVITGGDLSLRIGGDLRLEPRTTTSTIATSWRPNKNYAENQTTTSIINRASTLAVSGNLAINVDGTFSVTGSSVTAGGALAVTADRIAITGAIDATSYARDTDRRRRGLLSSSRTTTNTQGVDQTVVGSLLSGDTVTLRSAGDTSILGSTVVASNGLSVNAGGDLSIGTMVENDSENSWSRTRQSGLSFGGGGLFIGSAKSRTETDFASTTNVGSLVGSAVLLAPVMSS